MNIIEAVKTGLPMRRPNWLNKNYYFEPGTEQTIEIDCDDILADDWEVDEPEVTITRRDLFEAYNNTLADSGGTDCCFGTLAKRLGL